MNVATLSKDNLVSSNEAHDAAPVSSEARFRTMVDANFAFIWRSLRGLGVPAEGVDDAAQHVFWVASQKMGSIAEGSERSFLFGTALGVAANARRARARTREVLDEDTLVALPDHAPDAERVMEMKEARAMLDRVLEAMPDNLRAVFVLFALEGTPTQEIAELLSIPAGTVASRLRRARETFHAIAKRLEARSKRGGPR